MEEEGPGDFPVASPLPVEINIQMASAPTQKAIDVQTSETTSAVNKRDDDLEGGETATESVTTEPEVSQNVPATHEVEIEDYEPKEAKPASSTQNYRPSSLAASKDPNEAEETRKSVNENVQRPLQPEKTEGRMIKEETQSISALNNNSENEQAKKDSGKPEIDVLEAPIVDESQTYEVKKGPTIMAESSDQKTSNQAKLQNRVVDSKTEISAKSATAEPGPIISNAEDSPTSQTSFHDTVHAVPIAETPSSKPALNVKKPKKEVKRDGELTSADNNKIAFPVNIVPTVAAQREESNEVIHGGKMDAKPGGIRL
ncbi:hypothetical protein HDV05_000146 [Chytridiales sp. JEL 0842]|nr:hypothetical protein HDV05_000146 [Chytridiales sp. JEL 0842]